MDKQEDVTTEWMPLKTIYNKEMQVAAYLKEQHIEYYIPMSYQLKENPQEPGRCDRILVPAIHNLIFIHRSYDKNWCSQFQREIPCPVYFLKKERNGQEYCTISDKEMQNFIHATDSDIEGTRFIDPELLRAKKGEPVRVIKEGPLYGVTGKFLRYGNRHYVAIELSGTTALMKVSYTWCERINEQDK